MDIFLVSIPVSRRGKA